MAFVAFRLFKVGSTNCGRVTSLFIKNSSKSYFFTYRKYSRMLEIFNFRKLTPVDIEKNTEKLILEQRTAYDAIGAVPLEDVSYDKVIKAIADVERDRSTKGASLYFPQHASSDKALRDASCKADTKLEEFDVEMSMRKDVFDRIVAFKEKEGLSDLNDEQKRFIEKLILAGKRNGLHLSEEKRSKIKEIKTRMSELSIKFENNLNEDNTKLYFTKEELSGMPDDFIDDLQEVDGKLEVTLKYPHLFPITKKCRNPKTRLTMIAASQSKCMKENTPILEELIELRQRLADLLGYKNHASFIHEERMAKSPEKVAQFLSDLASKLDKLWKDELQVLLKLKTEECEKYNLENSGKIEFWDTKYYMNLVEETIYAVDEEEVRQYFPLEKVTSGLLDIYQQLLGLKFHLEKDVEAWHDDVLTPTICAMMCNFTKPTKDKPALLTHSEVETFFHEFGHAMHGICSKASFSLFAGLSVERDFVEAPSQMLENWVWEKEPLQLMSSHHKTDEPLPDSLIEKLSASRKANAGGFNLRQIVLGTFDQKIHTRSKADTQKLFTETYQEIMGLTPIENTNMPASFGHLAGGYDAQYYGYLWSEVFAMDMFESRFKKEGILSSKVGMDYRTSILQPGGSKDAADMLRDFLGRDPTNDAFLKSKGLQ
ncbi:Thimet oligopeptidase [Armadillidium nasatum]|uniref:Thimet oligopeptidase n=1 Tax=Armadillidium nasatum TaxID=96803 RepID=A0A5N5TM62_9CRUS|nr:Thimet oligopeptidase [Armadillidium nasatum]